MLATLAACALAVTLPAVPALPEPVRSEDIVADPGRFVGRRVRVEGRVAAMLHPRVFTVTPSNAGEGLAVAIPRVAPEPSLHEGGLVSVSGRVWLAADELFVGWPTLEPLRATILALAGRPLIVADSVRGVGGAELVAPSPVVRTIERIVSAPDKPSLVGRRVVLAGVTIHDMTGPRSLTVRDEAGYLLLVELEDTGVAYAPWFGERVDVDGVVGISATAVYPWSLLPAPGASSPTEPLYVQATRVAPSVPRP
jgi:hypothetical protein